MFFKCHMSFKRIVSDVRETTVPADVAAAAAAAMDAAGGSSRSSSSSSSSGKVVVGLQVRQSTWDRCMGAAGLAVLLGGRGQLGAGGVRRLGARREERAELAGLAARGGGGGRLRGALGGRRGRRGGTSRCGGHGVCGW